MIHEENPEHISVLRHHNRAVRRVNKSLRTALKHVTAYSDELFLELCEQDREAELAFEKLWALGRFDCGPRDYDYIVEHCLEALRKVNPIGGNE